MKARLVPLLAILSLAACIPRGGGEFRIGRNDASPETDVTAVQIVPEQTLIAETLSWDPAVVERNMRRVAESVYVVQPGDSLFAIASKTGAGAAAIADARKLRRMSFPRPCFQQG